MPHAHKKHGAYKDINDQSKSGKLNSIADMDTVHEETVSMTSDDSGSSDIEHLRQKTHAVLSEAGANFTTDFAPTGRRISIDIDSKQLALNTRRPSAIIAAFRRPSQALALCAATQRRFLSELGPRSRTSSVDHHSIDIHDPANQYSSIVGNHAFVTALSALYAKLLIVLGVAFPVTEVISEKVPDSFYQGFYLYLYTVSVGFVIFMYATLVREKAVTSIIHSFEDEKIITPPPTREKPHSITRFGSFYLRLGAIAFGIGSMVYSGLEFGLYFEMKDDPNCHSVLMALTPAVRMLLTLVQMQFIFMDSREIGTNKYKTIQKFGMMHMIATNMCEWLYVLVEETKHEIVHLESAASNSTRHTRSTHHDGLLCRRSNIMGSLVQDASPFLFPCTIEYSLICAVIIYEMWKEIKCPTKEDCEKSKNTAQQPKIKSRNNSYTPEKILQQFAGMLGVGSHQNTHHHFSLDCSHAHQGLFAGILLIVLTIISLIMFFVLSKDPRLVQSGIFEVNVCELVLYSLSLVSVIVAGKQMRVLQYKRKVGAVLGLDTTLLLMAQSGMFIYCMFSIIGCYFTIDDPAGSGVTGLLSEMFSLIQTVVQSMFILDAWWRRCKRPEHMKNKPGRQIVTFLLVANMAMWAINTLEKNRAEFRPTHLRFFGYWAWAVITHVSMPLAIFYRFHSTICLFEIWKNTYKTKSIYL